MGKAPDAFRTISEVADWLGVQTHVLRFWESKFTQVKPLKRAGGRRYYRPADMELLGGIRKLLHEDGLTIKGAQKFIRENGVKAVAELSPPVEDEGDAPAAVAAEAAAAMMPEAEAEVYVHAARAEDAPEAPVDVTGEAPAPAVEPEPEGYFDAVDVTGEDAAPAVEPEPEGYFDAVDVSAEEPAPAVEPEISETVDISGEEPAPAVEPEPEGYFDAVDVSAEEPAPIVEPEISETVDVTGEAPAPVVEPEPQGYFDAVDVTGEEPAPAAEPESEPAEVANLFDDEPEDPAEEANAPAPAAERDEDEELALPSFIRKPMEGQETTVPPLTPGPLPLGEEDRVGETAPEEIDSRFAGVGAGEVPDRAPEPEAEEPAYAPVDFVAAVAPDPEMPLPQQITASDEAALDAAALRPLYDRLLALRARMG